MSMTSSAREPTGLQSSRTIDCSSDRSGSHVTSPNILMVLNGIIFQYLEVNGLDQTYGTLYDECQATGCAVPPTVLPEISPSAAISPEDIQRLLDHFDNEEGDELISQWDNILQSLDMSCPPEAKKLNALIRIYVALIPHRNNFSTEDKTDAMIQLKEYFEIGTDECTNDEEMLGYFALPYVADLNKHPIFSKILTEEWSSQLRKRLEAAVASFSILEKVEDPLESDLAQLYLSWSEGAEHTLTLSNGEMWNLRTTSMAVNLTSSPLASDRVSDDDSRVQSFFEAIDKIVDKNKKLQKSHKAIQKKYSETIKVCDILLATLAEACDGSSIDMDDLQDRICQIIPDIDQDREETTTQQDSTVADNNNNLMPNIIAEPASSAKHKTQVSDKAGIPYHPNPISLPIPSHIPVRIVNRNPSLGITSHGRENMLHKNEGKSTLVDEPRKNVTQSVATKSSRSPRNSCNSFSSKDEENGEDSEWRTFREEEPEDSFRFHENPEREMKPHRIGKVSNKRTSHKPPLPPEPQRKNKAINTDEKLHALDQGQSMGNEQSNNNRKKPFPRRTFRPSIANVRRSSSK